MAFPDLPRVMPSVVLGLNIVVFIFAVSSAIACGLNYGYDVEQPWKHYNHTAELQSASWRYDGPVAPARYYHYERDGRALLLPLYCVTAAGAALLLAVWGLARGVYHSSQVTMWHLSGLLLTLVFAARHSQGAPLHYLLALLLLAQVVATGVYRRAVLPPSPSPPCCSALCPASLFALLRLVFASLSLAGVMWSGKCNFLECDRGGMFEVFVFAGVLSVLVLALALEDLLTALCGARHRGWSMASSLVSSLASLLALTLVAPSGARPFSYRLPAYASDVRKSAEAVTFITLTQCWLQWWATELYYRSLFHGVELPCCKRPQQASEPATPHSSVQDVERNEGGVDRLDGIARNDSSGGLSANGGGADAALNNNGALGDSAAATLTAPSRAAAAADERRKSNMLFVNLAVVLAGISCLSPYGDYTGHAPGALRWYELAMTVAVAACVLTAAARLLARLLGGGPGHQAYTDLQTLLHTVPASAVLLLSSLLSLLRAPHREASYGALLAVLTAVLKLFELSETQFAQRLRAAASQRRPLRP